MRIGHTTLTLGHLISKERVPVCEVCGVRLTVEHIVSERLKYNTTGIDTGSKWKRVSTLHCMDHKP